jgi:hypothetical protein
MNGKIVDTKYNYDGSWIFSASVSLHMCFDNGFNVAQVLYVTPRFFFSLLCERCATLITSDRFKKKVKQ